jgi:uncharacterized membrane protein (DUF2068 family)
MLMRLPSRSGYLGFRVIGIYKLVTGVLALIAGLAFVRFMGRDPALALEQWTAHLGLDRNNPLIHRLISALTGIDRSRLRAMEAGTFFFAALRLVEGVGLFLERDWAGYLVVIATSSLIPFEIYEIVQKQSLPRIAILIVNLGIVAYLIIQLRKHHAARAKAAA